jgi:hypothetical protein
MAAYRLPALDLAIRTEIALEMCRPRTERGWGRVRELQRRYGVSRTWLYDLGARAAAGLASALAPQAAGRPVAAKPLLMDAALIDRFITVLPMTPGTVRGIQDGLALIFGVRRSVGYISAILTAAGAQAARLNRALCVPLPVLGEADEIFQGQHPCLTVVDGRSFLALNLAPAEHRDGATWGVTFLDLQAQGITFANLTTDQGTGLLAGVREAQLTMPLYADLFHPVYEGQRLTTRLEGRAYQAIAIAERLRRAETEAQAPQRRRGRPLTVSGTRPEAETAESQAIQRADAWGWLFTELRQALAPLTPQGGLQSVAAAQATAEAALALLREVDCAEITAYADKVARQLPALLAPLAALNQQLAVCCQQLGAATTALIGWAWQHRQTLALTIERDFPAALQPLVRTFWSALALYQRTSSLAESLHSWLRPFLSMHRGMPQWLLPLLQLFWNYHEFERGKRAGHSPMQGAGNADAPTLADMLEQLLRSMKQSA